jgi:hypothetical protein
MFKLIDEVDDAILLQLDTFAASGKEKYGYIVVQLVDGVVRSYWAQFRFEDFGDEGQAELPQVYKTRSGALKAVARMTAWVANDRTARGADATAPFAVAFWMHPDAMDKPLRKYAELTTKLGWEGSPPGNR